MSSVCRRARRILELSVAALTCVVPAGARAQGSGSLNANQQLARDIYKELVEINTTTDADPGGTTQAAEAMAARLRAAGFSGEDVQVLSSGPRDGNLVARLRGSGVAGRKPILLLAHLDVVAALREDWTIDPFTFTEKDGYYYGRGTGDDKAMAAIWIANMIRMKKEGFVPDRDLIVALTADEEGGDHNGVEWLLANKRELVDAAYALNEGGGGFLKNGKPFVQNVQAAEKVYYDFAFEVRNKGGHSTRPVKDNAIYHLSGRPCAVGEARVPRHVESRDPRVLRAARAGGDRASCGGHARRREEPQRRGGGEAAVGVAGLQLDAAHDVRGDPAHGWPRAQRAAPARPRERELPGASEPRRERRARDARQARRRYGRARLAGAGATGRAGFPAIRRGPAPDRTADGRDVARDSGGAGDVDGRDGWPAAEAGRAFRRTECPGCSATWTTRARTDATSACSSSRSTRRTSSCTGS